MTNGDMQKPMVDLAAVPQMPPRRKFIPHDDEEDDDDEDDVDMDGKKKGYGKSERRSKRVARSVRKQAPGSSVARSRRAGQPRYSSKRT